MRANANPTLRYPCRAGRALVQVDFDTAHKTHCERPDELRVQLIAVSLSQGRARITEAEFAPLGAPVRPLRLLAHRDVFGVRQWAPAALVEWPRGPLRLRVDGLAAGWLLVTLHCAVEAPC